MSSPTGAATRARVASLKPASSKASKICRTLPPTADQADVRRGAGREEGEGLLVVPVPAGHDQGVGFCGPVEVGEDRGERTDEPPPGRREPRRGDVLRAVVDDPDGEVDPLGQLGDRAADVPAADDHQADPRWGRQVRPARRLGRPRAGAERWQGRPGAARRFAWTRQRGERFSLVVEQEPVARRADPGAGGVERDRLGQPRPPSSPARYAR